MKRNVSMEQMLPLMEEMLNSGKEVSFTPSGSSMLPLIHNKTDVVYLRKCVSELKKYDIPLYRRTDGSFVLHRIIGKDISGYILCGDHQYTKEYGVTDEQIIAVMTAIKRNGKYVDCQNPIYKIYSRIWVFIRPLRAIYFKTRTVLSEIKNKYNKKKQKT
ncbi:MAG: S24/S26 family peptidase [Clostridia bacterium]|nr:S24/S26 family peptidase [Clostridia bacterium]